MVRDTQIRELYTPVQPTVKQSTRNVIYHEFLPHPTFQPFVYCYWELKTTHPLYEPFTYRVVADGCIDIFFNLNDASRSFAMGFCKKYTEFRLDNKFHYAGVRFLPTMFPQIFSVDASSISNKAEPLDNVLPHTSSFIKNNFGPEADASSIKNNFDRYFTNLLPQVKFNNDNRLYEAIAIILKNFGVLNIQKDLDTGIS